MNISRLKMLPPSAAASTDTALARHTGHGCINIERAMASHQKKAHHCAGAGRHFRSPALLGAPQEIVSNIGAVFAIYDLKKTHSGEAGRGEGEIINGREVMSFIWSCLLVKSRRKGRRRGRDGHEGRTRKAP